LRDELAVDVHVATEVSAIIIKRYQTQLNLREESPHSTLPVLK
jgi:hypothetical protein